MIPARAATQKVARPAILRSKSGIRDAALAQHEGARRRQGDDSEDDRGLALAGFGRQVDRQHQRRHHRDREDAAEVVDRLGRLVDVGGDQLPGEEEGDRRQRRADDEDRAPLEPFQQRPGDQWAERRDAAAERRPERDRLGPLLPGPQRRDQRQRRRVGHAGGDAAEHAGEEEHLGGGGEGGEDRERDGQRHAEQQQRLAPVAVADRAEVEDGGGEAERVADRDQVDHRLAGVEGLADVRQGDVGDGEVEVGDPGDQDQRPKDEPGALGGARSHRA